MEAKEMIRLAGELMEVLDARPQFGGLSLVAVEDRLRRVVTGIALSDNDAPGFDAVLDEAVADHKAALAVMAVLPEIQRHNSVAWCAKELLRRSYSLL